jgi:hypothetical protein
MRKPLLLFIALLLTLHTYGQNGNFHYIKFVHVGEQIMPVHTLNISTGDGIVPPDSAEMLIDTLKVISIAADAQSYKALSAYLYWANFRMRPVPEKIDFGTFKIIEDGKRFYVPDVSVTKFFEKMVAYLKKKKADPQLIQAIKDNYTWIFYP